MAEPLRVLILEDNPADAELVLRELRRCGYDADYRHVDTEAGYVDHLSPDLDIILSDYDLPNFTGPQALALLKQRGLDVPFIIISGTIGEEVAVEAMRQGAADYLLKDRLARLGAAVGLAIAQGRLRKERSETLAELRTSEVARLQAAEMQAAILNALPANIALVDEAGVIVSVNESWRRFGLANNLAGDSFGVGRNYIEVCESAAGTCFEEGPAVAQGLREVLSGALPSYAMEYPCHSPEERRWFRLVISPLHDDRRAGAVIMHVDITERKEAENNLMESTQRFRQLAENIHEVFWITDLTKNQMLYVSPAYEKIWGRSCESLYQSPLTWLDAIHPEERDRVLSAATRQAEGTYDEEYRIVRPDGRVRWIRDRAFPVCNEKGEVYRMAGVAEDVTARRRADDQLREQASLLDKARDAIVVRDLEHRITYWNKGAERLYGWTAQEAVGRMAEGLLYVDPASFGKAEETVARLGEWSGECLHMTKGGAHLLIESRWTLVRDAEGRPKGILVINSDITEKKKLEQQFLRAQRLESIGTLAGGIAHDLNNVLAPIMMSIDLLKLTCGGERAHAVLSTIESSARRGADMVQQILSFARGAEGERTVLDPGEIIRDIQGLVQDTFPKNILFHADLPPGLPSFTGNHTQVHQVLLNLCVNARDAMPDGGSLAISASSLLADENYAAMTPGSRPGPYLVIKVMDTGSGIPASVVDKIFDPFFTTKEVGKGTGLGLSTVLAIVNGHGGFLNVDSERGKGTAFTVCFPADASPGGTAAAAAETMHPRGCGELVLIVDDEAAVLTITRQTLEAFGYKVLVAADGAEAIALYAQNQASVKAVLVDMMMPVMDGPATIQLLKRLNPGVKIIAASGLNSEGAAARASGMGVRHFLPKPYTAQTLLITLHRVVEAEN